MQRMNRWSNVIIHLTFRSSSKQCTKWLDGLYLLSNTTNTYGSGVKLTFWVPDCTLADPHYANNPLSQKWECKFFLL